MVKILFFGTAAISKAFLEELYKKGHDLLCITMPDRPAARGQKLTPPEVKVFSEENNIEYIQPEQFAPEVIDIIKHFKADVGIAVAYGRLIPESVFTLPKYNTFNIHFSLLPKYRGAAPVQYAIFNGDTETGVTSFYIEKTLDTGAILVQEKINIEEYDTAESMFTKLIPLGISVMNKTLECFKDGKCEGIAQQGEVSYAPALKKEDGLIDWNKSAEEIYNLSRGLYPWPGTYSIITKGKLEGKRIKIIKCEVFEDSSLNDEPGKVFELKKNTGFIVVCGKGRLLINKVQPENKPIMDAWSFIQGGQLAVGDFLN